MTFHCDFKFKDGNIILRASVEATASGDPTSPAQTISFLVHKSILSLLSIVFAGMMDLPQPSEPETNDGIPVVDMPDNAAELLAVLNLIYYPQ